MKPPRLLDLFCGAGGAAMGYSRAGFEVVGVDIKPQPNYPFPMVVADALDWLEEWVLSGHDLFDAIHASPPCQAHVKGMATVNREYRDRELSHIDLIPATRELLVESGLPYVIENVVGSRLREPITLCGTTFGLPLRRHRLFESNVFFMAVQCRHDLFTEKRYWTGHRAERQPDGRMKYTGWANRATTVQVYGQGGEKHEWPAAMGIDWMTYDELAEAIPPAYTEFIGEQLMAHLKAQVAA